MLNFLVVFWSFCLSLRVGFCRIKDFRALTDRRWPLTPARRRDAVPIGHGSHSAHSHGLLMQLTVSGFSGGVIRWHVFLMRGDVFVGQTHYPGAGEWERAPGGPACKIPLDVFLFNLSFSRFSTSFSELNVRRWLWQSDTEKKKKSVLEKYFLVSVRACDHVVTKQITELPLNTIIQRFVKVRLG